MTIETDIIAEANWHLRTAQEVREEQKLKEKRERELALLAEQTRAKLLSRLADSQPFNAARSATKDETVRFTDNEGKTVSFSDVAKPTEKGASRQTKLTIRTFSQGDLVMLERLQITTVDCIGEDDSRQAVSGGITFHRESIDPLSKPEDYSNSEEALGGVVKMINSL